jgi:hypothetical protein
MTDNELLSLLRTEGDRLTRERADEIVARGEAIGPKLAAILDDPAAWEAEGDAAWAPVHAAYLLGAIGGPAALPPLFRALQRAFDKDASWIYDTMPSLLGRQGPVALEPLFEVLSDARQTHPTRSIASEALEILAIREPALREGILDRLAGIAGDAGRDDAGRWMAASSLLTFARPQDRPLLETLARRQQEEKASEETDDEVFFEEHVEQCYRHPLPLDDPSEDWMAFYDPESIAERQRRREEDLEGDDEEDEEALEGESLDEENGDDLDGEDGEPPPPFVHTDPVVGRNDPCPCGSGKKYKKCCGP